MPSPSCRWCARSPACITVGPDYKLPPEAAINAPLANAPLDGAGNKDVAQQQAVPPNWWRLYDDPVLDSLVQQAMQSNTDLRVAAANLARSREALGVAEAQGGFSGSASAAVKRAQESGEQFLIFEKLPVVNEGDIGISVAYEIDLFGRSAARRRGSRGGHTRPCRPPPTSRASPWSRTSCAPTSKTARPPRNWRSRSNRSLAEASASRSRAACATQAAATRPT